MLLSIQFPLADSREFLTDTGRLNVPSWPVPNADSEFVRFLGCIRARHWAYRYGLGWANESDFCDIRNSVRFAQSPYFAAARVRFRGLHRRLYFDGLATGKTELGIGTSRRDHIKVSKKEARELLPFFLDLPVRLPKLPSGKESVKLSEVGRNIARLYTAASTDSAYQANHELPNWWITEGAPLVFFQCGEDEEIDVPPSEKRIDIPEQFGKTLMYDRIQYNGRYIPVWFFNTTGSDDTKATNLRLILSRLHTEHECLRIILSHLIANRLQIEPKSKASNMLQRYFNDTINRIDKMEHEADEQIDPEIAGICRTAMGVINPQQATSLYRALEIINMRRNIFHKVRRYTKKNTQTNNAPLTEEEDHRLKLIDAKKKRYRVLEIQKAQQGSSVEPKIVTEMEEIEKELRDLEDSDS